MTNSLVSHVKNLVSEVIDEEMDARTEDEAVTTVTVTQKGIVH